ncbi:hypothetical protein [Streptomyces sp. NPDC000134]|uniref:hypothetical protein n=1 Tax=Streptomyces sp. NPDC000134 TaxID=3364536 RepID=UPI0036BE0079
MYATYDLLRFRSAELIRRAEHEKLAREALRARRAARRAAVRHPDEPESHTTGARRRHRSPRAA